MDTLFNIYNHLDLFILVMLRVLGCIVSIPLLGRKEVPNLFKISVGIYFTFILITADKAFIEVVPEGLGQYILLCVFETIKGLLIGFLTSIFFSIFTISGQVIDAQIGFHSGGILDTEYGTKIPLTGNLMNVIAFIVFLKLDGHLIMIRIFSDSYLVNHIGSFFSIENIYNIFTSAFSIAYLLALKIAFPIILIILFVEAVLSIMIKFMPQLNIFVVGIPLKLLVGIFTLVFYITPLIKVTEGMFNSMYNFISQLY